MNDRANDDRDPTLRALLRDADPAAGDRLAPDEVWRLRRTALAAGEKAGRRAWLATPVLAAATAAVAAAVALWLVQAGPEGPAPRQAAAPSAPAAPAGPRGLDRSAAAATAPAPVLPPLVATSSAPPNLIARVQVPQAETGASLGVSQPAEPPDQPVLAEAAEPRPLHIEFSTPGGTRVIWTLTSPAES